MTTRAARRRLTRALLVVITMLVSGPLLVGARGDINFDADWRTADRSSAGIAPPAASTPEAVVQVYAARAFHWRGLFGVHTWVATKAAGAGSYTVHEVLGWKQARAGTVVESRADLPDRSWYDADPWLVRDIRGPAAAALIPQIEAAVASYPHAQRYRIWPGPNSNTFVAWIAREVPALGVSLPPTAIGKDYLGEGRWFGPAPSGTGYQLSCGGWFGALVARREGIEFNVLGLVLGVDLLRPALKLPGLGRVGLAEDIAG